MSTVTSKELDLSDPDDARLADLFYSKSRSHVQALMQLVRESRAMEEPAVDVSSVPKTLFCKRSCVSYQTLNTLDKSIWHGMRVLSHLHRVGPRESICFPIGFCAISRPNSPGAITRRLTHRTTSLYLRTGQRPSCMSMSATGSWLGYTPLVSYMATCTSPTLLGDNAAAWSRSRSWTGTRPCSLTNMCHLRTCLRT